MTINWDNHKKNATEIQQRSMYIYLIHNKNVLSHLIIRHKNPLPGLAAVKLKLKKL